KRGNHGRQVLNGQRSAAFARQIIVIFNGDFAKVHVACCSARIVVEVAVNRGVKTRSDQQADFGIAGAVTPVHDHGVGGIRAWIDETSGNRGQAVFRNWRRSKLHSRHVGSNTIDVFQAGEVNQRTSQSQSAKARQSARIGRVNRRRQARA